MELSETYEVELQVPVNILTEDLVRFAKGNSSIMYHKLYHY